MTPTILSTRNWVPHRGPILAGVGMEPGGMVTATLLNVFWISLGAIAGANSRYFLSRWVARNFTAEFPWGTLLINFTGSLLLGFFMAWTTERVLADPRWRLLVAIGFCGSYTTFSSYAVESISYFEQGHWWFFAANVLGNNALCLAAALAGIVIARAI